MGGVKNGSEINNIRYLILIEYDLNKYYLSILYTMQEEFRTVQEYPDILISNLGNLKGWNRKDVFTLYKNKSGYYQRDIENEYGEIKHIRIHRLVAIAFLPNPSKKPFVDHIDNNRLNNNVNNLRWCTNQENQFNRSVGINNKTGVKGVKLNRNNQWEASITASGNLYRLGKFDKKEDAIIARSKKAIELFGEFVNKCEIIKEKRTKLDEELEQLEKEFLELIK